MEILVFRRCAGDVSVLLVLGTALLGDWVTSHKKKQKDGDCMLEWTLSTDAHLNTYKNCVSTS
jgi:hypothetical protein